MYDNRTLPLCLLPHFLLTVYKETFEVALGSSHQMKPSPSGRVLALADMPALTDDETETLSLQLHEAEASPKGLEGTLTPGSAFTSVHPLRAPFLMSWTSPGAGRQMALERKFLFLRSPRCQACDSGRREDGVAVAAAAANIRAISVPSSGRLSA